VGWRCGFNGRSAAATAEAIESNRYEFNTQVVNLVS
jgi:hypothetical protein|tara:strand:- start:416 stop:523 length:108 start_codon:yes stop_codon:yes gene_type:complete